MMLYLTIGLLVVIGTAMGQSYLHHRAILSERAHAELMRRQLEIRIEILNDRIDRLVYHPTDQ